ncbi:MAG: branched-chain amino acid ABC transporter substrate-binding protein [Anaerolineae bacterium]
MKHHAFYSTVVLAIVALLIVACGGAAATPAAEQAPAESSAPEATAGCEDALGCVTVAPGSTLKIASALSVSGPTESLGLDEQYGAQIALTERGEILGFTLELKSEDDGCSAEGGQTAATKIASDNTIVAVVGHTCSSSCTPAASIYNDANLTMVSPSCTAPALTAEGTRQPSFLRTAPNDKVQGRVMAEFAYNELGVRTAATIHDGSPYAEQLQQVFADVFTELGGKILAQEAINVGDTDMRPVLTSIAAQSPELLYYPIFIAEGGFITTQAREVAGLEDAILAGSEGMISPDFLKVTGDAAEGMYLSGPDLNFSGTRYDEFLAKYREVAGQDPTASFHAHTYDATNLILDAVEKVAKTDDQGNLIIGRQALRDAIYATSGFDGITGSLSCDALGDCADPKISINQVQDGQFTAITGASGS